jgi:uncharacterized protein involved in exopolysaccharide biosynthesis
MTEEDFLKEIPEEDPALWGESTVQARDSGVSRPRKKVHSPSGMTVRDVARMAFKHKWTVILSFVLVGGLGIAFSLQISPWYEATARLQVHPNPLQDMLPGGSTGTFNRNILADQVQLLQSDNMLQQVVEHLYLDEQMLPMFEADMGKGDRVSHIINILKRSILDIRVVPDSNFITITAQWPEKDLAATIPNTLADLYVETVRKGLTDSAQTISNRYSKSADETKRQLDNLEGEIEEFLKKNKVSSVETRIDILRTEAANARERVLQEEANLLDLGEGIKALEEELARGPEEVASATSAVTNPEYVRIKELIDALNVQRTTELARWKADSPPIKRLDRQIEEYEKELAAIQEVFVEGTEDGSNPYLMEVENNLANFRTLERHSKKRMDARQAKVHEINIELASMENVSRDYERLLYAQNNLQSKYRSELNRALMVEERKGFTDEILNVSISDRARRPVGPATSNLIRNILLSLAAGFALGIALATIFEITNRTLETTDDVERYLGLPVLGTIRDKVFR